MGKRLSLLGGLKVTAVLCTVFPILPVFCGLMLIPKIPASRYNQAVMLALCLLSCLAGMLCGAFLIPAFSKKQGRLFDLLANVTSILAALLCGAAGFFAGGRFLPIPANSAWVPWYAPIAVGVCCLAACILGCRCWEEKYSDIIRAPYLTALIVADLLCSFLFWALKQPLDMLILSLTLLFAACVYAAAENQGNIDYLMQKRSHNHSILPRRMRWYSFSLVLGISVLIFGGYFLRKPIAAFFSWVVGLLKSGISALLRLLPQGEPGEPVPETPMDTPAPGDMGLPPAEGESSIFWTFFGIAVAVLLLWLIFYYRHEIWSAIRTILGKIRDFLSGLLFRRAHVSGPADANEYFEDNVEELSREPGSFWKRERPYDQRRWKKEYKAFRAMPDGVEKLREGYRLAMQHLLLKKIPLAPADTPADILKKGQAVLPADLFACVTNAYCLARYAGKEPDSQSSGQAASLLAACDRSK